VSSQVGTYQVMKGFTTRRIRFKRVKDLELFCDAHHGDDTPEPMFKAQAGVIIHPVGRMLRGDLYRCPKCDNAVIADLMPYTVEQLDEDVKKAKGPGYQP